MHGSVWGAAANAEGPGGRGIPRGRDCSTLWAPQPPVTSSGDALGREGWRRHLVSPAGLVPPADSLATGPLSAHQELWGTSSVLGLITYFTLVGAQGAPCNLSQRLSQGHGLSCPRWPWFRSANGLPHHFVLLTPCPRLSHVKGGGGPGLPHRPNQFVTECLILPCTRQAPEPWGCAGPPRTPIQRGRPMSKHKVPQGRVVKSWATFFPSGSPASGLSGNQKTQ